MKKTSFAFLLMLIPVVILLIHGLSACAGQNGNRSVYGNTAARTQIPPSSVKTTPLNQTETEKLIELLDGIAELERSGLFRSGLGGIESSFRERMGDYTGAVMATYKEMSWDYGHGNLEKQELIQGLERVASMEPQSGMEQPAQAAHAILSFIRGKWDDAGLRLRTLVDEFDEPDSFINWMILSCSIEQNPDDRKAVSAYKSIRARYVQYPEYWYRGAKVFPGVIASQYAEYCVTIAPDGPYAPECRRILAVHAGLKAEDGPFLKSKKEIENIISLAVSQGDPYILDMLIPLISLPENPFTVYAIGALRGLASIPQFLDYFTVLAAGSKGRLTDRLVYICRG